MEREILMTEDTDTEILAKGRKLLLLKINQDSIQKARELMDFLDTRFQQTRVMPFWKNERELLTLWLSQYDYLLETQNLEPIEDDGYRQKIVPPRDLLGQELQEKSKMDKTKLLAKIISSNQSAEEKQFLQLLVATWVVDKSNPKKGQDSLNTEADLFLSEFPKSKYVPYVRKYIRFVYIPSVWRYGYDFSLGYIGLSGNISNRFDDATTLGMGFDIFYKQFIFFPRMAFGFGSSVKQPFSHPPGVTWNKGLSLSIMVPEITIGYLLIESDFIQMTPFAGVAAVLIAPPENERDIPGNNVKLNSNASLLYGVNIDLHLSRQSSSIFSFNEIGLWNIKVRLAMSNPSYTGTNAGFSGSCFYITVGFGGFYQPIHRDE
jgi:hypothetical protein